MCYAQVNENYLLQERKILKNTVLLFPGQGSQNVGMGQDIFQEFTEFKQALEEASDALSLDMPKLCFEDPDQKLNLTEFTQPSILAISIATFRVLQKQLGIKAHLVAGHSLGEYSALVSVGALGFSDALKAVHFRGQAMQRAVPVGIGGMAAYLGNQGDQIPALCKEISTAKEVVEVVNFNSPGQLVLSGHKTGIEKACQLIADRKLGKAKVLAVSAPFHSSLMQPASIEMEKFLDQIELNSFSGKIVANVDAQLHTDKTYTKKTLVKQIANPVLWTQTLAAIQNQDADAFQIEVGPGKVLSGLTKKTLEGIDCLVTNDFSSLKNVLEILSK